jgi:hypothetical protein
VPDGPYRGGIERVSFGAFLEGNMPRNAVSECGLSRAGFVCRPERAPATPGFCAYVAQQEGMPMSFAAFERAIFALPRGIQVGGGVVLVLLLIWLMTRLSRRRHVVIGESESIRTAIIQMARIADSLERLSFSLQTKPPGEGEAKESARMFSSLGR